MKSASGKPPLEDARIVSNETDRPDRLVEPVRWSGPIRQSVTVDVPLVSCIMPTYNRRRFIGGALRCFFAQDYPHLELIVVDDGTDPVADLLGDDPRIRYIRLTERRTVGAKRNLACEDARGTFIVHWDDDDWYPSSRVSRQVAALRDRPADVCGSSTILFENPAGGTAYLYRYTGRPWVAGSTLAYRREHWQRHPFADVQVAEDAKFLWHNGAVRIADLLDPTLCIATIHPDNVSPKHPFGTFWRSIPPERLQAVREAMPRPPVPGQPLVSCVLATFNRRAFLPLALDCYDAQTYPNRELIVVDDGDDAVEDLVRDRAGVRYLRVPRMSLGAKRNAGCAEARGQLIALWDDDDWYGSSRLERQIAPILRREAELTGLRMRVVLQLPQQRFWTASEKLHRQMFAGNVTGGTSVFPRALWTRGFRFPDQSVGEDGAFVRQIARRGGRVAGIDGDGLFVYVRHGQNTWQFEAGRFLRPSGWRELRKPEAFPAEILHAYATAAGRHASSENH